jgi:hypothetical protein
VARVRTCLALVWALLTLAIAPIGAAAQSAPAAEQAEAPPPEVPAVAWRCLAANPSCARDPWWLEWNELQDGRRTTYLEIGPRFSTERRFVEAINLIWRWPEGQELLAQADAIGVQVITMEFGPNSTFGGFSPARRLVAVDRGIATAPTWLLADVIAHELSHAADVLQGRNAGDTREDCIAGETGAFGVEGRFLAWLNEMVQPEGIPDQARLAEHLAPLHARLVHNMYRILTTEDIPALVEETYGATCSQGAVSPPPSARL